MKRIVFITVTIGATLLGVYMLWVFRAAIELFAGSLALAVTLRPLVRRLEGRGMSRAMAIVTWYLAFLMLLLVALYVYGSGIAGEITQFGELIPRFYEGVVAAWQQGSPIQRAIASGLPPFEEFVTGNADTGLAVLGGIFGTITGTLVFLLGVLSLGFFWLLDVTYFERLLLSLLPVNTRIRARDIWRDIEQAVGTYIRSTLWSIGLATLLLTVVYLLSGLPGATTLALLGGFSYLIPRLGPALALIPAVLIGFNTSPLTGVLVLVGGVAVQVVTSIFVARTATEDDTLRVNPLLQVVLLLALADLGGLSAMIFAPPLAALIQVLYYRLFVSQSEHTHNEQAFDLLMEHYNRIKDEADTSRPELVSVLRRSDDLLRQARQQLRK